jgi:DNA-binding MarR family transcriptional regulator
MEATKVDRMTASQTIRSLEKKQLVVRVELMGNKRRFGLESTQKGVRLADDALGKVIEVHTSFFAPLGKQVEQYLALSLTLVKENSDEGIR